MVILLEDLGNLAQVNPEIIALFTTTQGRMDDQTPHMPEYDRWSPPEDAKLTQSRLCCMLGRKSQVRAMKYTDKNLLKLLDDSVILIFVANKRQVGFISSSYAADHDGTSKVRYLQFYKTSDMMRVFSDEELRVKGEGMRDILTAEWDDPDRRGSNRRGGPPSHLNIDSQKKIKDFAVAFAEICVEAGFNYSLMTVGRDPDRKHRGDDHRRPPMPGEQGYTDYSKAAKKDLLDRLVVFKANKNSFKTPEDILRAARAGDLFGVEEISAFNAAYKIKSLDREKFGTLLAGLFGRDVQEPYSSTKPVPAKTEAPGIRYEKFEDNNEPETAPAGITVWFKVSNGTIVVGKMQFHRTYKDPKYEEEKSWFIGSDEVSESYSRFRKPYSSLHLASLKKIVNRAGST